MNLAIAALREAYEKHAMSPEDVVEAIYTRIERDGIRPIWIELVPQNIALERARSLANRKGDLPLWGIPFAVKDNIDVAEMPTTAGCPDFAYLPAQSATVVQRLLEAGALLIGKTNLDQFATGLVGVRSPYGSCSSVFDERFISGGSSSGSAVAVAKSLVSFSLGTDTAGSGRVPAAFNALVGLKPTRGLVSTAGVFPACRTLDCVSIFAGSCADAGSVLAVVQGFDPSDPFSRLPGESRFWPHPPFRFGVPRSDQMDFFGDAEAERLFEQAARRMQDIGGTRVEIDFAPFREAGALLYSGPWIAERLAAVQEFVTSHPGSLHPVVSQIILSGERYSAVDAFHAIHALARWKRQTAEQWECMDLLLLPTAGTVYTHEQVAAEPVQLNTNLGYYTNFVNLLDLAAVAVPAGFRKNRLPFGVSLVGPAFTDGGLLGIAEQFGGGESQSVPDSFIPVAVVGAHLTGQPLNHQLTSRGAKLMKRCQTDSGYRLYALSNTTPPKPGLVREPAFQGPGVEVEVWAVPPSEFGTFVAGVPAPLGIGTCLLADGSEVKSFICEPFAIADAREITSFGGWRNYLDSLRQH